MCINVNISYVITNLGGVADGEQPCEHTGIANGQDPKHPGQPQQGKENDSGLQGGSDNRKCKYRS